jgi:hypothetical protein
MRKYGFFIIIIGVTALILSSIGGKKDEESYINTAIAESIKTVEYSKDSIKNSRTVKKKKVVEKKSTESKKSITESNISEKNEKKEVYKPITAVLNPGYSDKLGILTGYNINNIKKKYIAGRDIAPGLYWTGTFGDTCELARLEKKSGKWDYGTYGGEQVIFIIDIGDTLHTSCNWYQRELPKFIDTAPTGIVLASQLGIGSYEIINRGSCFFTIEKLGTFSYNNRTFLPDMPLDYKIIITQEDIKNNMTINTDITCKGIKRVS